MKALTLRKLLDIKKGSENYIVRNYTKDEIDYIAVGEKHWPAVFSVNKKTLEATYQVDFCEKSQVFAKLKELVKTDVIHDIINGDDVIENPITVFSVTDGVLIQAEVDPEMPNVERNGNYLGDIFPTREEAVADAINKYKGFLKYETSLIKEIKEYLLQMEEKKRVTEDYLNKLEKLTI
jgi:hypothetical protein